MKRRLKTAEAAAGITRLKDEFSDHPYGRTLEAFVQEHGDTAYPGSPMLAARLPARRPTLFTLQNCTPREHAALDLAMSPYRVNCHRHDGFALAHSILPPTPRRGLMLIDPSYEIKNRL